MVHDETLFGIAEKIKNFAVICTPFPPFFSRGCSVRLTSCSVTTDTCDITQVPDFTKVRKFARFQSITLAETDSISYYRCTSCMTSAQPCSSTVSRSRDRMIDVQTEELTRRLPGNKHIMVDLGTGNNNKINWAMDNKQEVSSTLAINDVHH